MRRRSQAGHLQRQVERQVEVGETRQGHVKRQVEVEVEVKRQEVNVEVKVSDTLF